MSESATTQSTDAGTAEGYVMDFSTEAEIQEDEMVDEYMTDNIKCVVDAKIMLYLYRLELDYSDELIGGGFKFFNPNAKESCGCGSSSDGIIFYNRELHDPSPFE
eukprot:scaffold91519_cov62-Attheya_sp.AAC.3